VRLLLEYNYYRTHVLFVKPEEMGTGDKLMATTCKKSESAYDFCVTSRTYVLEKALSRIYPIHG
jgi:type IV secretory pathway VirB9-like protein